MYSFVISILVYSLSYWYLSEYLEEFFDKGMLKTTLVVIFASLLSWGVASAIDFIFPSQAISIFGDSQIIADTAIETNPK